MSTPTRFIRIDLSDGASEVLTICKLAEGTFYAECLDRESPYVVQITSGPSPGDDFVGVYDLDGEKIDRALNWRSWKVAEDVPTDVVEAVEEGWASGSNIVRPLTETA